MTLPNFPIRTRLIPYDDLGIQEVSPNLLSLQNDVDIVLAALMAMGKHGSQMLQADDSGNLRVGSGVTGNKFSDYKKITLLDTTTVTDNSTALDIDLSNYSCVQLIVHTFNYFNNDNALIVKLEYLDNHGNYRVYNSVQLDHTSTDMSNGFNSGSNPFVISDKLRLDFSIAGTTPSIDLYVDAVVI